MKRILSTGLLLALVMMICACGKTENQMKPEDTIIKFSEAMNAFNIAEMDECFVPSTEKSVFDLGIEDEFGEQLVLKIQEWSKQIQYEVISVSEDGYNAEVVVKYTYADAKPVAAEFMADYITQAVTAAYGRASDEELDRMALDILTDKLRSVPVESTEKYVGYSLEKVDNEWKIVEMPDEAVDVLTADFIVAFEVLSAALEKN